MQPSLPSDRAGIHRAGIHRSGIHRAGIPKAGIPKEGIPKEGIPRALSHRVLQASQMVSLSVIFDSTLKPVLKSFSHFADDHVIYRCLVNTSLGYGNSGQVQPFSVVHVCYHRVR